MMAFQSRLMLDSFFRPNYFLIFPPTTVRATCEVSPPSKHYSAPSGNSHNSLIIRRRFSPVDESSSRRRKMRSTVCFSALTPELKTTIDKVVTSQKVVLFMKGTKEFPQCGFSHTVVQILMSLKVPFETINILENDLLRQALKEYSTWPTFPQLYIDGEFFGGCDITVDSMVNKKTMSI